MRPDEEVRRLHSRHSARQADRGLSALCAEQDTLPGSIYLGVIAVLPNLFLQIGNGGGVQNLPFGGTAVLIMIGVGWIRSNKSRVSSCSATTKGSSSETRFAGTARGGQGHTGREARREAGDPANLDRRAFRHNVDKAPNWASRPSVTWTPVTWCPPT